MDLTTVIGLGAAFCTTVSLEGLGSMLCAPIPHSLRSNSPIRTHDAINGMTLK
jgi:hypothetical protein